MTGVISGLIGSMKGQSGPRTAPTSLSAIATSTNVAISFTAPSDDGGSAITNYEYSLNNVSWTALSPADAVSPITVSGLTQSTAYNIYLKAVNIGGSGPASSAVSFTTQGVPTATIGATTNFTESRAVFNATINGNLATTTVSFQYSTASNFSSFTSVAGSGSGTGSFSSSATVTGLAVNTTYYVRAVATNSVGATTSGSTSFLTWRLIQWANGTPGTYYLTVPTVSGVNPAALVNTLVVGGGGGGSYGGGLGDGAGGGGGAGGYRYTTSRAFNGPSGALTIVVGSAGGGGANQYNNGGSGTQSYITGTNMTTYSAGGGEGGYVGTNGRGGNVGTGDNAAHAGGGVGVYNDGKSNYYSGGGGAGVNGGGGGGYYSGSTAIGGAGGPGGVIYFNLGAGGGGTGDAGYMGANGSSHGYGSGGQAGAYFSGGTAGTNGAVVFNYYGP